MLLKNLPSISGSLTLHPCWVRKKIRTKPRITPQSGGSATERQDTAQNMDNIGEASCLTMAIEW